MKKERVFWGLFFIVGAIAVVVNRLGFLGDLSLWTVFFTVFLAAALIKSVVYRNASGILFSLALICILYAKPLGITAITPWPVLGAALLGSIGCSILFHPWRCRYSWRHYPFHDRHQAPGDFETETIEGKSINLKTSFSGSIKYINSDDFKTAYLDCSFGSMKVYFDNAVIQDGLATVTIDASFCGVELFIPKEWKVENRLSASFGGVEEKNRNISTGSPILQLTGDVSFSGVTIIYI